MKTKTIAASVLSVSLMLSGSMAFAQQVADLAQRQNHHPTLLVQWGTCVVRWSSHDAGNTVTPLDVECAALTDALMPAGQA